MRTKEPSWYEIAIYGVMLLIVIAIGCGVWVGFSSMEAKTYNRLTGANVTTWEAMWVELRVQESPTREAE